ncbi:MAG: sel1 repeat family protein, partial [Holosporales bacterium]|nr:sel1 repeat family protein [Holosporales bacterium]
AARCWWKGIGVPENEGKARQLFKFGAERAIQVFKLSADQGDPLTSLYLSECLSYTHEHVHDLDYFAYIKYIKKSADLGLARAQFLYGRMLEAADGVARNLIEAARYYKNSADQGDPYGQLIYGNCLEFGIGTPTDLQAAAICYDKSAAQSGNSQLMCVTYLGRMLDRLYGEDVIDPATLVSCKKRIDEIFETDRELTSCIDQCLFGIVLEYGLGGAPIDLEQAAAWYKMSAEAGCVYASYRCGRCFEYGIGVRRDTTEAARYYEAGAIQDDLDSLYSWGRFLWWGIGGVAQDLQAARTCSCSGSCKLRRGRHYARICLEFGKGGVPTDLDKSAAEYKISADLGDADAQCKYGICLEFGIGGASRDLEGAVEYYKRSANQGNEASNAEGKCRYGICLEFGIGVRPNPKLAVEYYRASAKQGNASGLCYCGRCLESGIGGVPKNLAFAAEYYKLSAEQGNAYGQCCYGRCVESGIGGVPKYPRQAAQLYKMSADQGNAEGQCCYGRCVESGIGGVPKDPKLAVQLYKMSADQGNAMGQCYYSNYLLGSSSPYNLVEGTAYAALVDAQGCKWEDFQLGARGPQQVE